MIAQIALDGIQVILALVLFGRYPELDQKTKRRLLVYGTITVLYLTIFALWDILDMPNADFIVITGITVLPMALATFFVFITHKAKLAHLQDNLPSSIS